MQKSDELDHRFETEYLKMRIEKRYDSASICTSSDKTPENHILMYLL